MNTRGFFLIAGAIGALLIAAGCGDEGDSADANGDGVSVRTGSLPKTEFVKRANALCEKTLIEFQREYEPFLKANLRGGAKVEAKAVRGMLVPHYERLIDRIGSLGAPSGDEDEVAAILETLQRRLDEFDAQPSRFFEASFPFTDAGDLARKYGLRRCAEGWG